jgi:hypothetical protein
MIAAKFGHRPIGGVSVYRYKVLCIACGYEDELAWRWPVAVMECHCGSTDVVFETPPPSLR